jgi:hypothetical protein
MTVVRQMVTVDGRSRSVRVATAALRGDAGLAARSRLLARAFGCRGVESVEVDAARGTAVIHLAEEAGGLAASLAVLADALRGAAPPAPGPAVPADAARGRRRVTRLGHLLTTWRIGSDAPDRLRLDHPLLGSDRVLAGRLERLVREVPGVLDGRLTLWTHTLVVRFDADRLDAVPLVGLLQRAVDEAGESCRRAGAMAVSTTSLALAAASDLVLPVLAPVSAVMLVGTNLATLRVAAGELLRRRPGVATLAATIILGTLTTGQFLASGLMAWSFDFWRRRHRRDIEAERALLVEEATALPALAEVVTADGACMVDAASVLPGDRIRLAAGDELPVDGTVVEGAGIVEDRWASGRRGVRAFRPGDRLAAGGVLLGGRAELLADGPASRARLACIGALVDRATRNAPGRIAPTADAERYADSLVPPTLATAGLGLLAGDVGTAVAVMRPDYATAEAMTASFEDLDAVACCLAAGCLPGSARALESLAAVDTIVITDQPGLEAAGLAVSRVVTVAAADAALVRHAASLGRHLADERADALLAAARGRRLPLLQTEPHAFGDDRIEIVETRGGRRLALVEAEAAGATSPRPLVLEVDGRPAATFEFSFEGPPRMAALAERLQATLPGLGDRIVTTSRAERAAVVRRLVTEGRRVAVVVAHDDRSQPVDGALVTVWLGRPEAAMPVGEPADSPSDASHRLDGRLSITILDGDVLKLADLFDAAIARRTRLAHHRRLSLLPNVACVAGVFLLGFTSLVAAIVCNAATLGAYHRAAGDRRRHRLGLGHLPRVRHPPTAPACLAGGAANAEASP